jgi:hypothetical protein
MLNKKYIVIIICIIIFAIFYIQKNKNDKKTYQNDTKILYYDKSHKVNSKIKNKSINIEYKNLSLDNIPNKVNKINTQYINYQKQEYAKYQENIKYTLNKQNKLNHIAKIQQEKRKKDLSFRKQYEAYDKIKQNNLKIIKKRQIQDNTDKQMITTIKRNFDISQIKKVE